MSDNTGRDDRLPDRDIRSLKVQKFIDWLFFPPVGFAVVLFIRLFRANRFLNLNAMRARFKEVTASGRPTLVCSNHLTMFDSIFIHYALNNVFGYLKNFRFFSWNVPAVEKFKTNPFISLFTYLGKCVPIDRFGDSEHHKNVLNKLKYLLLNGEIVTIFPEGGRSRTGRVDIENVTYGTGNILKELKEYQVICIYMRGLHQTEHTALPKRGDDIYFAMEVIEPVSQSRGIRAAKEISTAIILKLKEMEDDFFQKYPAAKG
jgi:1-acyl-sn-glycerol-3-phosphate acyltransferase